MDDRQKRQVGEQVEPGGRPKAPGRLELLQRFLNSWNHDLPLDWDRLGTRQKAQSWLRQHGLVRAGTRVSSADSARLRSFREAIRSLIVANADGNVDAPSAATIRDTSSTSELVVTIDERGRTRLEPDRPGVDGAVAILLGIVHEAQLTGEWSRFKACRQCEYAFFDRSKNRSATWCAMSICGNRAKNRAHYRRHRRS
jgi:predicted RNA-binding Zn ribbon-like protein